MRRTPLIRAVLLLCLLVLQAQLFASAALGCRHAVGTDAEPAASGCPFHAPEYGTGGSVADPLDCHKCVLHLGVGGPVQLPAVATLADVPFRPITGTVAVTHFYQFTPESPFRPPISPLA